MQNRLLKNSIKKLVAAVFVIMILPSYVFAQGAKLEFFYDKDIDLPYASCQVKFANGAAYKIPFLPIVNIKGAPCGTNRYTQDIDITAPLVFIGNGIFVEGSSDCYSGVEIQNKIAFLCYDFPDSISQLLGTKITNEKRIEEAVSRGAAGIVLFSIIDPCPSLAYWEMDESKVPEIPMITINRNAAETIFQNSDIEPDQLFKTWQKDGVVSSIPLAATMTIKMAAQFDHLYSKNFTCAYQKPGIDDHRMQQIVETNDRAVDFLLDLFESQNVSWRKSFICYFRDYDAKVFYKRAWGKGNSGKSGAFMVYDEVLPEYTLAVHENTHTLTESNWGESTSFMSEGFAMYAETMAGYKNSNHQKTIDFLRQGQLVPLDKIVDIYIGTDPATPIAYPASGSFVGFVVEKYGLSKAKALYVAEGRKSSEKNAVDSWHKVLNKSLSDLEMEWLSWLRAKFNFSRETDF